MSERQRTLGSSCSFSGVGIHTGKPVTVTFEPAPADHGIVFVRRDLEGSPEIPVRPESAKYDHDAGRRTILEHKGAQVHTTEHVLATVYGLGIDNVRISLDGLEAPEPEKGGTAEIAKLLKGAGFDEQDAPRRTVKLTRPISFTNGTAEIIAVPSENLRFSYTISYDDPLIGSQHLSLAIDPDVYETEIAPARTFVLHRDVEALKAAGMALGGSLDNALVVKDGELLNDEPLRFRDEFVRHKLLDLCGDLAILGRPLRAHIVAIRGGHESHVAFVKKLARTLAEDRPVVLMDEPFSKLDAITRRRLQILTADLLRGRTVLMGTHDPLEALTVGHSIVVLGGRPVRVLRTLVPNGATPRMPDDATLAGLHAELLVELAREVA